MEKCEATREQIIKTFVREYKIDVPAEKVENELNYIRLEMKHHMQYDTLTSGTLHLFPDRELKEQEELEEAAAGIAMRQNASMEMVKRFFGEDFKLLESDVLKQKAENWIFRQAD